MFKKRTNPTLFRKVSSENFEVVGEGKVLKPKSSYFQFFFDF